MPRLKQRYQQNGFYGIGLIHSTEPVNIGTLWRSAHILGAAFIFTIQKPYRAQGSDVTRAWTKIPLYHFETFETFYSNLPHDTRLVGVEMTRDATALNQFIHPDRAVYLLGSEQTGLPRPILDQCHSLVSLPGEFSLNVAVAGSIVMYDRISKLPHQLPKRKSD